MGDKQKPWEVDDIVYFSRSAADKPFSNICFVRGKVEVITRDSLHIKLPNQKSGELCVIPRYACYPTLQALYDALHEQMDVEFDLLSQALYPNKEE